jgi:hypothetical protein
MTDNGLMRSKESKRSFLEFISAAATAFELFPTESRKIRKILETSDEEMNLRDWQAVGADIRNSIVKIELPRVKKELSASI